MEVQVFSAAPFFDWKQVLKNNIYEILSKLGSNYVSLQTVAHTIENFKIAIKIKKKNNLDFQSIFTNLKY